MNAEFECRKCGNVVPFEQYKVDRFCPHCGTLLQLRRQPKYWIFQFNPTIYRWFDWIKENRETEQWLTSQHAREIREKDKVAIWASGNKAGIYAIGEVVAKPRKMTLNPEQEKYWTRRGNLSKFREKKSVIIRYLRVFIDKPILEDECKRDPVLSKMKVLEQPQGTNFPLTKEQWNRILELLNAKHEKI